MDKLGTARAMAHLLLAKYTDEKITSDIILEELRNIKLIPAYSDLNTSELVELLEADFDVHSGEASFLINDEVIPWVYDKEADIKWELWNRFKMFKQKNDPGFPINSLDDLTSKILDKCVDPSTPGPWDRRGMVVGHVQSGKTSNYIGLINKATDAGYKLIIVIAGIHNSLRSQTQKRIDAGFIGRRSSDFFQGNGVGKPKVKIGVGEFEAETQIFSFTSSEENGDFNKRLATNLSIPVGGRNPIVLVIKKNKHVLEGLISWFSRSDKRRADGNRKIANVPMLVIDDEADNASVNSGKTIDDIRTINRLIRVLLNLFEQNTFIGYTATPYANLFIPSKWSENITTNIDGENLQVGEDLFPRDFIVNIQPPTNYVGAAAVFGYENQETGESFDGLPIIRSAEDQEPYFPSKINKHNRDQLPDDIPQSLDEAIKAFILTCAIRRVRGQIKKHNSMLVHVALRVNWIDKIAYLVNERLRYFKQQIKTGQGPLVDNLKDLFESDFQPTTRFISKEFRQYKDPRIQEHSWDAVKSELLRASSKIKVTAVHGRKNTRDLIYHEIEEINYDRVKDKGLSVIAVGGNRLARGITLEGLSISYYLRTSRMYDSLMQMGRWFGYRPGYVDLCRLYTTGQLINWYRHVTVATEEMRADFDEMAAIGKKPKDYQLKVRTHSGMLSITSASKMKEYEKIQVGFSGDTKQTFSFEKDEKILNHNLTLLKEQIKRLPLPSVSGNGNLYQWSGVSGDVISNFISEYLTNQPNIRPQVISSYIRKQLTNGDTTEWTIGLFCNTSKTVMIRHGKIENGKRIADKDPNNQQSLPTKLWNVEIPELGTVPIGLTIRNDLQSPSSKSYDLSKNAIMSPGDFYIDLTVKAKDGKAHPSKADIRKERAASKKGLLMIYLLDPRGTYGIPEDLPIVGFGISFPEIRNEELVEFAARTMEGFEDSIDEDLTVDEE